MSDVVAFTPEEQKKFDAGISELLGHYPADRKRAAMLPAWAVPMNPAPKRANLIILFQLQRRADPGAVALV